MKLTKKEIANVFRYWLNDYNENPDDFNEEYGEVEDYGDNCAEYFSKVVKILREDRS